MHGCQCQCKADEWDSTKKILELLMRCLLRLFDAVAISACVEERDDAFDACSGWALFAISA